MDFFYENKISKPARGHLLVSEPYLPDPNFERTVVLLCASNDDGAFGFVLNKPSALLYNDIMEDPIGRDELVYVGGPVQQDTLHFLHQRPDIIPGGVPIWDGLYWGGDFEKVKFLLQTNLIKDRDIRFFIGYSGWGPGQLEEEILEKSWIIAPYEDKNLIFNVPAQLIWKKVLENMGGKFKMISNYPRDPRLN